MPIPLGRLRARRHVAWLAVVLIALPACGGNRDASSDRVVSSPRGSATDEPSPTASTAAGSPDATGRATDEGRAASDDLPATGDLAAARIELDQVADLDRPIAMAMRPDDDTLYVAEKGGTIRTVPGNRMVLDISSEVTEGNEQGLLGIAFSPDGDDLYVSFTNRQGDSRIRGYTFSEGRAQTGSAREVLALDQPYANHNGGNIVFGPDGYLYIGFGDGGSAGDPQNNAQDLNDLLGKILRIDPDPSGSSAYTSPRSNPFVGREGRDEIWAYGLRNPWRFSFDRATGALWTGDVGQGEWEEIDVATGRSDGGENYGWREMEGTHRYGGGVEPRNHRGPIYEYSHADGNCSVTGGYVYRGSAIPDLRGAYVFADFCVGRLRAFVNDDGQARGHRFLGPRAGNLASFAQDHDGELYVLSLSGGLYKIVAA